MYADIHCGPPSASAFPHPASPALLPVRAGIPRAADRSGWRHRSPASVPEASETPRQTPAGPDSSVPCLPGSPLTGAVPVFLSLHPVSRGPHSVSADPAPFPGACTAPQGMPALLPMQPRSGSLTVPDAPLSFSAPAAFSHNLPYPFSSPDTLPDPGSKIPGPARAPRRLTWSAAAPAPPADSGWIPPEVSLSGACSSFQYKRTGCRDPG